MRQGGSSRFGCSSSCCRISCFIGAATPKHLACIWGWLFCPASSRRRSSCSSRTSYRFRLSPRSWPRSSCLCSISCSCVILYLEAPTMPLATDWDLYYDRPLATAKLTRRYTGHWLRTAMRNYAAGKAPLSVIEFGGGNSCFFRSIVDSLPIGRYEVVDLNQKSLGLFE